MHSSFFSPYFLAGLLAGAFFFLTAALVGLSLFAAPSGKQKLMRAQSMALGLVTLFLLWLGADLWESLQGLLETPEPIKSTLDGWGKHMVSLMVLGIAVVFGSLITGFGWVRAGFAGNAVRSVLWALIGVRMVTSAVTLVDLMTRATGNADEIIPDGELAGVAQPIMDALLSSFATWTWVVVTAFAISVMATVFMRKN